MTAPRIALLSPNRDAWSETFIAAHIEHLPGVALVLTDGHLPRRERDGTPLLRPTLRSRAWDRVSGTSVEQRLRATIGRRLKEERIGVVLAEYGPTGDALLPVCRSLGLPLVVHFHGIDAFHGTLLEKHHRYAALLRGAEAVVVVSREMEAQLRSLGAPPPRLHHIPYGIDTDRFAHGDPSASKRLLAVGRFVDKKAPHLTLLAFQQALREVPDARLTFVGDGMLHDSSVQLARALGIDGAVEFAGVRTPDEVAALMQRSRAFVQHSLTTLKNDHEGTPLSVLEAMASGLPVISTRHGGIPDVVRHDVTGLLGAERDIAAMAEGMVRLLRDADGAVRMGRAGRAHVLAHHRLPDRIQDLHGLLRRVQEQRAP